MLESVVYSDAGDYTCNAMNIAGTSNVTVCLLVLGKWLYAWKIMHVTQLKCHVHGHLCVCAAGRGRYAF